MPEDYISHPSSSSQPYQEASATPTDIGSGKSKRIRQFKHTPLLKRGSRACTFCRQSKSKCVGADEASGVSCQKCRLAGSQCIFPPSRRPSKQPASNRYQPTTLSHTISIHTSDSNPSPSTPAAVDESTSHSLNPLRLLATAGGLDLEVARGTIINQGGQYVHPSVLRILTREQVIELHEIWWNKYHPMGQLFDPPPPNLPGEPLLIATVCAITSQHYKQDPTLRSKIIPLVKELLADTMIRGLQSVAIASAFMLLGEYPLEPNQRGIMGPAWSLIGSALRMAMDLALSEPPRGFTADEQDGSEREFINRQRCCMGMFSVDRAMSIMLGKPSLVQEDPVIYSVTQQPGWAYQKYSKPLDAGLSHYCQLQRIMSRVMDVLCWSQPTTASGLVLGMNYQGILKGTQAELNHWVQTFPIAIITDAPTLPSFASENGHLVGERGYISLPWTTKFEYYYYSLMLSSFGLQNAIENEPLDLPVYFLKVQCMATDALTLIRDTARLYEWTQYASESRMVMITYCAIRLLKLIRPAFKDLHTNVRGTWQLLNEVVDLFVDSGVDDQLLPRLYGLRLRSLLVKATEDGVMETSEVRTERGWDDEDFGHLDLDGSFIHLQGSYNSTPTRGMSPNI